MFLNVTECSIPIETTSILSTPDLSLNSRFPSFLITTNSSYLNVSINEFVSSRRFGIILYLFCTISLRRLILIRRFPLLIRLDVTFNDSGFERLVLDASSSYRFPPEYVYVFIHTP